MGGLAARSTLRQGRRRRRRLRAGRAVRAHRRRHPDAAEFVARPARHRRRGPAAQASPSSPIRISTGSGTPARSSASCRCRRACTARRSCACIAPICTTRSSRDPPEIVHLGKKLVGLDQSGRRRRRCPSPTARKVQADAVIGADGVHSRRARIIVGPDAPIHRGRIAYRAVFDAELHERRRDRPSRTKWWGPTGTS